jgi:16S rRNA processing protein RimM
MLNKRPEPHYLAVGRILRPHGVRGELRVEILTDFPEHLTEVQTLYVGKQRRVYTLKKMRFHQDIILMTLTECPDRNTAETLRGELIEIAVEDAVPLEEDEYYHYQLIGLCVETDEGDVLGEVVEVFEAPGANDVLIVHGPRGEILLPAIEDVILDIDFDAQKIQVHLLPGLVS